MTSKITLTFAGDADSLAKAGKRADDTLTTVGKSADKSGEQLKKSSKESTDLGTKMGHLGSTVSGASDAFDAIGGSLQSVVDLQQAGAERASKLARALVDVQQAQEDLNQALRDGAQAQLDSDQAAIDLEQANLDAAQALKDYGQAVKEHGVNSAEAKQAQLDLKQAQQDARQASEDSAQAQRDAAQATIDASSAQNDLNDATREAHPPEMAKWAQDLDTVAPLITAVVGVVGLATSAQWLWNASLWASPVTWIVAAVLALAGVIIYLATQTTFFQDTWAAVWGFLKVVGAWFAGPFADFFVSGWRKATGAFSDWWARITAVPGQIKSLFSSIGEFISAPFRAGFNLVSTAWNATVGRLSWTVPSWVPGLGGNTFSAPKLPHFHSGGVVPGSMGSEVLAVLRAGERVSQAGGDHAEAVELRSSGSEWDDMILQSVRRAVGLRGNDPVRVLRDRRG